MNKLVSVFFIIVTQYSFGFFIESDLSQDNLKGKVKSVITRTYIAEKTENGVFKKGELTETIENTYNKKGNYLIRGKKGGQGKYAYDFVFIYEYDDAGRLVKETKSEGKSSKGDYTNYTYNEETFTRHGFAYDVKKDSISKSIGTYNKKGRLIVFKGYYLIMGDWDIGEYIKFYYDSKGRLSKEESLTVDDEIFSTGFRAYNKKERVLIITQHIGSESNGHTEKIVYDKNGNGIELFVLDENGNETPVFTFKFTYDKKKNWILSELFEKNQVTYYTERDITYY